jgi:hypothetical protein
VKARAPKVHRLLAGFVCKFLLWPEAIFGKDHKSRDFHTTCL